MKNRVLFRFLSLGVIASMAFLASCAKESENNMTTALAAALVIEDSRSYDAMPLVPAALASKKGLGGSSALQSVINDAVPQGKATNSLKQVFAPVRGSILIGKELVQFSGKLITRVEELLERYPGLATLPGVPFNDYSDLAHPGRIASLSTSGTFGAGGRKVEIWWSNTGSDTLRDGRKILELDYRLDASTGNIDGVLFFRHLPEERPDEFALVRVEFRKEVTDPATGAAIRTAHVYVENYVDFRNNTGANAAFFITENAAGVVTVEGGYTVKGLLAPFLETNGLTGWGINDERVYLFNGAGSIASGKAVVNVVLPLRSQSGDVGGAVAPFANGQLWSLGELFTDGLLNYMQINTGDYGILGTQTFLWLLNYITGSSLDTDSTQDDVIAALSSINLSLWGISAAQIINDLKVITGIKNPVYFEKSAFSINLVGQLNTSGLDGASDYDALQGALSADFTWFTMEELFNLDIAAGTSVDLISGHAGIEAWTGINAPAPTL